MNNSEGEMINNKRLMFYNDDIVKDDTNNNDNKDEENNNKRKRQTKNNTPSKKFKNNELIDLGMRENNEDCDSDSDDENFVHINNKNDKNSKKCPNPLCDHKDFTKEELKRKSTLSSDVPRKVENINDLLELGKTYHCKKNMIYHGVDLKILCDLIEPLNELKLLVGMKHVKESIVNQILFFLQGLDKKDKCGQCLNCYTNYKCDKEKNNDMLHTVLTGSPGVGKTELGKILGKVYKAMGFLSKGTFNIATRNDLVGKYLGHTAAKTQAFIDKCIGGVMFIDEAYSLGNQENRDSFSKECIDTINQNLSENRDFLVIIAGYADALDKCFFNVNPGLARRFAFRYDIPEYTSDELMEIFLVKVIKEQWKTEFQTNSFDLPSVIKEKEAKLDNLKNWFKKNKSSFGSQGGAIEQLFVNCKIAHARRMLYKDPTQRKILTMDDIEKGFVTYIKYMKTKKDAKVRPMIYS